MRDLSLACSLALAFASGCYASHGRSSEDGGVDPIDARPVDAPRDGSWLRDARATCAPGDRCDDGDACTTSDHCRDGACVGTPRSCESPPSACFAPIGACAAGECVYDLAEGVACDDGDACTVGDACAAGGCSGEPLACDAPPPALCLTDDTLRTFETRGRCDAGSCTYALRARACPDGCIDGACRCVPTPWAVTVVDTPMMGGGPGPSADAIALDESGGVHVVYSVVTGRDMVLVRYAHLPPGGAWRTEPLGQGRNGRIAIAPAGAVHVVYVDGATNGMTHLERAPGASWARSTVPIGDMGSVGSSIVMAIDPTGVVHVAFSDLADTLVHASRSTAGVWSESELTILGARSPSAAAVDPSGGFHVSYTMHHGEQRHAYRSPTGSWSSSATGHTGASTSDLAIDHAGGAHVIYTMTMPASEVVHAYLATPGGTWLAETLGPSHMYGASIAVAERGVVHAVFSIGPTFWERQLRHAWRDASGVWSSEEIAAPFLNSGGLWTSLAADRDGGLHLVFMTAEHALVYAHRRVCP